MPLQLSRMTEADIPAFAAVDAAGMANWGMAQAMNLAQPGGEPREVWVERWMRADFRNDDEMAWVKVTDPEAGGEMIAAALWDFRLREKKEKANEEVEVEVEVGAPAEGAAPVAKPEEQHGVMAALGKLAKEFHDEFIGTKPFAKLHILVTHSAHQRRGAGSMLVQWGCDRADELGLQSCLTASQAGLGVYLKHEFVVVKETLLDLKPFGVDEVEVRRGMIRPPKAKAS